MSLWRPARFTLEVACSRAELQERLHYMFAAWTDPQERIAIYGEIAEEGAVTFSASPTGGLPARLGTTVTGSGRIEPHGGGSRLTLDARRSPGVMLRILGLVGGIVYVVVSGWMSGTAGLRTILGLAIALGIGLAVAAYLLRQHARLWGQVQRTLATALARPLGQAEREELEEIAREDAEFEAELAREDAGAAPPPADGVQATRIDNRPIE